MPKMKSNLIILHNNCKRGFLLIIKYLYTSFNSKQHVVLELGISSREHIGL
jgi:hypothetical protein